MRDRRFAAALAVLVLGALLVGVTGGHAADDDEDAGAGHRFERIENLPPRPVTLPAELDPDRRVTVVLQVEGKPVGLQQADAEARGRELSHSERATRRNDLARKQSSLHDDIEARGGRVLAQFQDAYNGIKVRAAEADVAKLGRLPGVVGVHRLEVAELANVDGVPFIGAPAAWQDLGITGAGVKIAIIDTGVDYFHADFGGSGDLDDFTSDDGTVIEPGSFPTAKVVGGKDFVGDDYNPGSVDPADRVPHPDPDPKDCQSNGHGTHVAGTAAGQGVLADGSAYTGPYDSSTYSERFKVGPGVAPEAKLYAYRIYGCGRTGTLFIIDAINQAVIDDVDVINLSLGSPFGRADDPLAVAADVASAAGIVVVAVAGNQGPSAYITHTPGSAEQAISVAAMDAVAATPAASVALPSGTVRLQNSNGADLSSPITGALRVLQSSPGVVSPGCNDADYASVVPGDIVVTKRGVCARQDRATKGQAAGAAAVIMINDASGFPPPENHFPGVTIPFLGAQGGTDSTFLGADDATVTVSEGPVGFPNPTFKRLPDWTSGGPRNGDSAFKPDVSAPGVAIRSAQVGSGTGAARREGTSMATPHIAGVAALAVAAHPGWTPAQVKAAIVNTADASLILNYNPRLGGSGVVQPRRVVDSVASAAAATGQPNLSFGYEPMGAAFSETLALTVSNESADPITYNLAAAFSGSSLGSVVSISPSSVTVGAGSSETVDVTLSLSAAAVAALPRAQQAAGAIVTLRGAVTATPTSAAPGVYPLRVPFLLVPRGLSNVQAGAAGPYTQTEGIAEKTVPLSNTGIHAGNADIYAWGLSDPADTGGEMDVRSVGVQALPGEAVGVPGDTLLVFAVNFDRRWSNASGGKSIRISIDLQHDGRPDFHVVGVDLGIVLNGLHDGRFGSVVFDADFNIVNAFFANAPMNGSTVLLPALASDLGLTDDRGHFRYTATGAAFGVLDFVDGVGQFNAFLPPVSTGDFLSLAPGGPTQNLTLTVDRGKFASSPTLGWLAVTMDDANGAAQADQVPVGKLPPNKP